MNASSDEEIRLSETRHHAGLRAGAMLGFGLLLLSGPLVAAKIIGIGFVDFSRLVTLDKGTVLYCAFVLVVLLTSLISTTVVISKSHATRIWKVAGIPCRREVLVDMGDIASIVRNSKAVYEHAGAGSGRYLDCYDHELTLIDRAGQRFVLLQLTDPQRDPPYLIEQGRRIAEAFSLALSNQMIE